MNHKSQEHVWDYLWDSLALGRWAPGLVSGISASTSLGMRFYHIISSFLFKRPVILSFRKTAQAFLRVSSHLVQRPLAPPLHVHSQTIIYQGRQRNSFLPAGWKKFTNNSASPAFWPAKFDYNNVSR